MCDGGRSGVDGGSSGVDADERAEWSARVLLGLGATETSPRAVRVEVVEHRTRPLAWALFLAVVVLAGSIGGSAPAASKERLFPGRQVLVFAYHEE